MTMCGTWVQTKALENLGGLCILSLSDPHTACVAFNVCAKNSQMNSCVQPKSEVSLANGSRPGKKTEIQFHRAT